MARPQILQMLKHGKMLCGNVFKQFVETWNYIINRVENLKGDADANPQTGHIKIDNTDPEHPIMRLVNIQDFGKGGGGGSGECIEMQGTPTGNVPIDCQGKLVKFNTAADSNVEVDVQETVAGTVDVTIGVYYV